MMAGRAFGRRGCRGVSSLVLLAIFGTGVEAQDGQASVDWKSATAGYVFSFPRDHASHPDYKIEWWYYTGNLAADDGRRFGYQVTFFRIGVDPRPANPSAWAVRDLYMAHVAVSDISAGRFWFADRLNRAGVGWAGAETDTYRVWNEDWEVTLDADSRHHRLRGIEGGFGVELELEPGRSPVIHGDAGISQKGAQPGNASHYYSLTRMPTRGTLVLDGERIAVEGASWMDHEFGTSFLEEAQMGWDWFSIQLDDGTDLMLFQLRRSDRTRDPHSGGTLIRPDGKAIRFGLEDFDLAPGERWSSPESGAEYPVDWMVGLPAEDLRLEVRAALADQELRTERSTRITYWEGAVEVSGTYGGRDVRGRGYLEMTGYAGTSMGEVLR